MIFASRLCGFAEFRNPGLGFRSRLDGSYRLGSCGIYVRGIVLVKKSWILRLLMPMVCGLVQGHRSLLLSGLLCFYRLCGGGVILIRATPFLITYLNLNAFAGPEAVAAAVCHCSFAAFELMARECAFVWGFMARHRHWTLGHTLQQLELHFLCTSSTGRPLQRIAAQANTAQGVLRSLKASA